LSLHLINPWLLYWYDYGILLDTLNFTTAKKGNNMLKTYFRIAWRTLAHHKVYTFINVLGLTLGICACLAIWTIVRYEFSFDRHQPDRQRIYRIITAERFSKQESETIVPAIIPPLPAAVKAEIPGIEAIAPYHILFDAKAVVPVQGAAPASFQATPIVADAQYFRIMPYTWLAGSSQTALQEPFRVVLTERKARQYFGVASPGDWMGRELVYNDSVRVRVSGIIKDQEKHTDFPFMEFISLSSADHGFLHSSLELDRDTWKGVPYSSRVLLKLSRQANTTAVTSAITTLYDKKWHAGTMRAMLQPLSDVHFTNSGSDTTVRTAHLPTLYALMSVALFILALAMINYINLATAQSLTRDKEIGIRKVLGSNRRGIMFQFLLETLLLTMVAATLAALMVNPVLQSFRDFIPAAIRFDPLSSGILVFMLGIVAVTTLLAGIYPAGVLASYLPVLTLKGSGTWKGGGKWLLRKGLTLFQFTISLGFIIGTLVIGRQIHFMLTQDLGFKSDASIEFSTNEGRDSLLRVKQLEANIRALPGIKAVARENMPPMGLDRGIFTIEYKPAFGNEKVPVEALKADEYFIPLYDIRLLAGRNLLPSDTLKEVVINERLSKLLGFKTPAQAIGQSIYTWNKYCPIVGVVADFHHASFHEAIRPMLITGLACTDIAVKLDTKNKSAEETKALLARIEKVWAEFYPHTPFEYTFLDDSLAQLYQKERTMAWLMNIATAISIFVSCIGLFGLTMFTTQKRTREIGIRKVLGAGVKNIVAMLSRDFIILVMLALLIASPIAWLFMQKWLQDYAYRISVGVDIFLLAGILLLAITLATISLQAIKAAMVNPVKSLRTE